MENVSVRLAHHVLDPASWIARANGNVQLARYYQNQVAPVASYQEDDYQSFSSRLVLLNQAEWELLGFSIALSPFAGSIATNMNGSLRRAVKHRLCGEKISELDKLSALFLPTFLLPPNSWDDASAIAHGGIAAVLEIAQLTPEQEAVMSLRFEKTAPAVSNLTLSLVEVLCKISLPTHAWLFQEAK